MLAINITQGKASFSTGYCYGEEKTKELILFLKEDNAHKENMILAPNDILYDVSLKNSPYRLDRFWENPGELLSELKKPNAGYLVYSVPHNTISQFKKCFLDVNIQRFLNANFKKMKIGTYVLWIKL